MFLYISICLRKSFDRDMEEDKNSGRIQRGVLKSQNDVYAKLRKQFCQRNRKIEQLIVRVKIKRLISILTCLNESNC